MKKYESPEIEINNIFTEDVITTSLGTETSPEDEGDGTWEIIG